MGSNSKRQQNLEVVSFSSVEQMPNAKGAALFITDSSKVFKDDIDIAPVTLTDGTQYMPWGGDNLMPYHILEMVEKDETLSTCQMFNAEVCYGSGLVYNTEGCTAQVKEEVEDFLLANSLPSYFLGVCQDFKHFGWCVSVIILDNRVAAPERGVLLPLLTCGRERAYRICVVCQLEQVHWQYKGGGEDSSALTR